MAHLANPDTAIRKATDFAALGKPDEAFRALHALLSRRGRQWSASHEQLMEMYINLAVECKQHIKDGLMQYQKLCSNVSPNASSNLSSLDKIAAQYATLAEAKAKSEATRFEDVTEAADNTPEAMLRVLTSPSTSLQDGAMPWVKYLWEAYRSILDSIRNIPSLLPLYLRICGAAFESCAAYKRPTEFRRFADLTRGHLDLIRGSTTTATTVDLGNESVNRLFLESKLNQLKIALRLDLWQEAFRGIEDILVHHLDQAEDIQMRITYHEHLAGILRGSHKRFHACALATFFVLCRGYSQSATPASASASAASDAPPLEVKFDSQKYANRVLLAVLSVTPEQEENEEQTVVDENEMKLESLLQFEGTPTREGLLEFIKEHDILSCASEEVKDIFRLFQSFSPLSLNAKLQKHFASLNDEDSSFYIPSLNQVIVHIVTKQISSVYKSMSLDRFRTLYPKMGPSHFLERMVMDVVRCSIDHRSGMIRFLPPQNLAKQRLALLTSRLEQVIATLPKNVEEKYKERKRVFENIGEGLQEEQKLLLQRLEESEARKEVAERKKAEEERVAAESKRITEERLLEERKKTEAAEQAKRAAAKLAADAEERAKAEKKERIATLTLRLKEIYPSTSTVLKQALKADDLTLEQQIAKLEHAFTQKEDEVKQKRTEMFRAVDHFERALRYEESLLLADEAKSWLARDRSKLQEEQDALRALAAKEFAERQEMKHQMEYMAPAVTAFIEEVMVERRAQFQAENKRYEDEQKVLEKKRAIEQEKREKEEEKRRKEEKKRKEEDAAREKAEEEKRAAKAAAEKEKMAKLNELTRKQREREAEIEESEKNRGGGGGGGVGGGARDGPPRRALPPRREESPLRRGNSPRRGSPPFRRGPSPPFRRGPSPSRRGPSPGPSFRRGGSPRRGPSPGPSPFRRGPSPGPALRRGNSPRRGYSPRRDSPIRRGGGGVSPIRRGGGGGVSPIRRGGGSPPRREAPRQERGTPVKTLVDADGFQTVQKKRR